MRPPQVRGAGLGHAPSINTALPGIIDAYWCVAVTQPPPDRHMTFVLAAT